MPGTLAIWVLAARPKTLWAGITPVAVGTALAVADGVAHWPSAALCLLAAVSVQVGANYANDYYDFRQGTDTAARIGPTRATQAGWVRPGQMRAAFVLAFAVFAVVALVLARRGGWLIPLLAAAAIASGILYTAGPWPLGYIGLGDVFACFFFGPVAVAGTDYVQRQALTADALVASVAPGLFAVAMLTVNNLRDVDGDRLAGKRTLAVRWGRGFARAEYLVCIAGAAAVPAALVARGRGTGLLLAALVLPAAIPALRWVFTRTDGPTLNRALAYTGVLMLLYAVLFVSGALA